MHIAFTPEQNAFRDELREYFGAMMTDAYEYMNVIARIPPTRPARTLDDTLPDGLPSSASLPGVASDIVAPLPVALRIRSVTLALPTPLFTETFLDDPFCGGFVALSATNPSLF